jgi:tRNA(fMet)-specific endonuclease VapC
MSYLLDANACIQYLNGRSEHLRQQLSNKRAEEIVLCSVVKAELFFGAQKSLKPERNLKEIRKFFNRFTSIPFDDAAAEAYGRIRSQLEKLGTPIGPNDLLIAAIAVANQIILITHNTTEFGRVEGLIFEDWEI